MIYFVSPLLKYLSPANDNEGGDGMRADTTKDSWWVY